jgi:hypothetical protein
MVSFDMASINPMATAGEVPVYADNIDPVLAEFCHSGWVCQVAGLVSDLWSILMLGLFAFVLLVAVGYLDAARPIVSEERSRTAAEREAFLAFAQQVADLSPAPSATSEISVGGGALAHRATEGQSTGLDAVRRAYRDTLMALDHYEDDYDEPLAANMAVELGEDIAGMIETGSELSAPLQQALVAQAKAAAAERARFMDSLNREAEDLRNAEQIFSTIEKGLEQHQSVNLHKATFGELSVKLETLDELENQCEAVLSDRQVSCRDHPIDRATSAEAPSLLDYLYEPLEVTYPVLATGTELLDRIETARRGITKSVYSRA